MRKSMRLTVFMLACLLASGATLLSRGQAAGDLLTVVSPQLVTGYAASPTSSWIYHYRFDGGYPTSPWISGDVLSGEEGSIYGLTGSGDIDNDEDIEVYAISNVLVRIVPVTKRTKAYYYTQRLSIYDPGSSPGASPSLTIEDINGAGINGSTGRTSDCIVADVDGDSFQELVVLHNGLLAIYQLAEVSLVKEWETPETFEYALRHFAVGNVDADQENEIVAATISNGAPLVFDRVGAGFSYKLGQPCTTYSKGDSSLNLTYLKIGNSDNDNLNEIVCGGSNYRLMVWKYNPEGGAYELKFTSPSLGSISYANIGDVGGDSTKEIVAGMMGNTQKPACLWIFAREGSQYVLKSKTPLAYGAMAGIEVSDLDADTKDEVIVPGAGVIKLYNFVGADLATGVFSEFASVAGSLCEIR